MPWSNEDTKYFFQILNAILQELKDGRAELRQNRPNPPGSEEIYRWEEPKIDEVMRHDLRENDRQGKAQRDYDARKKKRGRPSKKAEWLKRASQEVYGNTAVNSKS